MPSIMRASPEAATMMSGWRVASERPEYARDGLARQLLPGDPPMEARIP